MVIFADEDQLYYLSVNYRERRASKSVWMKYTRDWYRFQRRIAKLEMLLGHADACTQALDTLAGNTICLIRFSWVHLIVFHSVNVVSFRYREAGKQVAKVLQSFTSLLERASVDEAYLDVTNNAITRLSDSSRITRNYVRNTHTIGCDTEDFISSVYEGDLNDENNLRLLMGAVIAEEIRAAVFAQTGKKHLAPNGNTWGSML